MWINPDEHKLWDHTYTTRLVQRLFPMFHLSVDGTRVLNYAEWIDEASHRAALERSGIGAIGSGPKWRAVQSFPGLKASRVTRYRLDRRLVPASATGVSA